LLYIDDDVLLSKNFLQNLYKDAIKNGNRFVLSPCYYDNNKKKIHNVDGNLYFNLKKFFHLFLFKVPFGKKRMGFISKAGSCYGVDPDYINKEFYKAQWFPGGCFLLPYIMMQRNFYFNIRQKSFGEDLLLSYILKKKCSIIVSKKLSIYTEKPKSLDTKKEINQYLNAHRYLCKKIKLNNFYTKLWRLIFLFKSKILVNG
jgi:GT2 family glycosyltransferase